jgi:hypothetical protein
MLRSAGDLRGYRIQAVEDEIGAVKDVYFDEDDWVARYLVVDTGPWLSEQLVLVSPLAVSAIDWSERRIVVALSRRQVEGSPPVWSEKPFSRQMEERLTQYYGWPVYWASQGPVGMVAPPPPTVAPPPTTPGILAHTPTGPDEPVREIEDIETAPRSFNEVVEYCVRATDGELGTVHDLIVDDHEWAIRYIVAATGSWLSGKKVLVAPAWVRRFNWSGQCMDVDLTQAQVTGLPAYDPSEPVNRVFEERMYDYLGRPKYWVATSEVK